MLINPIAFSGLENINIHDEIKKSIYNFANSVAPSASDIINLGKIYNSSGLTETAVLAFTMIADKILTSQGLEEKNYVTNSTFWGYMVYKSLQQIYESKKINTEYKVFLDFFCITSAAILTKYGKDIFSNDHNIIRLGNSTKLVAEFFDKDQVIAGLIDSYNKSYIEATKYVAKNYQGLITNKFILHLLSSQALIIGNILITKKLLPEKTFDLLSTFLVLKENNATLNISKLFLTNFANKLVGLGLGKIQAMSNAYIEKEIDLQIANLAFDDNNREKIIKIDSINLLSDNLNRVITYILPEFADISNSLLIPLITADIFKVSGSTEEFLNKFASFILSNEFKQLASDNIQVITKYLKGFLFKESNKEDPYCDSIPQKSGNFNFNILQTPTTYAYPNIQEITKIGANKFILNKLTEYINYTAANQGTQTNDSFITESVTFLINAVYTLAYVNQISALGLSAEAIPEIQNVINSFHELLRGNHIDNSNTPLNSVQEMLNRLKNPLFLKLKRTESNDKKLIIDNYHLKNSEKEMLDINRLELEPGHIYAITGKIGTGKTTFLSDIAKCMSNAFESEGEITYPTSEGKELPLIFCGSIPFSPPATTLFEKLTYRLPKEYVEAHKNDLINKITELFEQFGQKGFSESKLNTKGHFDKLNLSTGQGKLTLIISSILYKEYLGDTPTIFVMDETLANLDEDTTNLVFDEVKKIFKDSIIVSVDHNAKHATDFYTDYIKLEDYVPINNLHDNATDGVIVNGEYSNWYGVG